VTPSVAEGARTTGRPGAGRDANSTHGCVGLSRIRRSTASWSIFRDGGRVVTGTRHHRPYDAEAIKDGKKDYLKRRAR